MSFKDALRKKITLDRLAHHAEEVVPSVRKEYEGIDREAVRRFLTQTAYRPLKLRDLEMWSHGGDGRAEEVLVLDNDLPLYHDVSPEEVAMRRSPELKEIFSVGNIKKIMNDRDILLAKGRRAIIHIHEETVSTLDLSFTADDIMDIVRSGSTALSAGRPDALKEDLDLLFELLGYQEMERLDSQRLYGRPEPQGFRDVVMIEEGTGGLKVVRGTFAPEDEEGMSELSEVAAGTREASAVGPEVLNFLGHEVLRLKAA
jgi:hypothetical protein